MNYLNSFFLSLGIYNLVGSIFLLTFLSNRFGNLVLFKYFKIFSDPYKIDSPGVLWLTWVVVFNVFFSLLNILAIRWDLQAQSDLLILDLITYVVFLLLTIIALFSPRYSIGMYFNFPIFLFWIIWGLYLCF